MYMVYWTEVQHENKTPKQQEFDSQSLVRALGFIEELRARQRAGEGIRFVTLQSENPDSVGNPGVAITDSGYDWKKRRR